MPAKQHPARATFKHQGRTITVEMIDPKVLLNGHIPTIEPGRLTYRIPFGKRGAVVDVVGTIAHATFLVTGWRHPLTIKTATSFVGYPIIIKHIEIGHKDYPGAKDFADVDLDGLPLGKIRIAAQRAATFTGKLKTRKTNSARGSLDGEQLGKVGSPHPYLRITELDKYHPADIKIGGTLNAKDTAAFGAKYENENAREYAPMDSDRALKEIAKHYKYFYKVGRENLGWLTCAQYLAKMTGRKDTTCQQMVSKCKKRGFLVKTTKRKRGTK